MAALDVIRSDDVGGEGLVLAGWEPRRSPGVLPLRLLMLVLKAVTQATAAALGWPAVRMATHGASHCRRHAPGPVAFSRYGGSLHTGRRGQSRWEVVVSVDSNPA